jgi:hypothetical protein
LGGVGTGLKVSLRNLPTLLTDELKVLLRNLPTLLTDELRKFPALDKMLGVGAVLVVDTFLTLRLLAAKKAGVARAVTNPVISPPLPTADSNPLGLLILSLLIVNRPCAYMPIPAAIPAATPIPALSNNDLPISLRLFVSALNDLDVDLLEVELLLEVLGGVGTGLKVLLRNLLTLLTDELKWWLRNLPTLLTDELRKFPASDKMLGVGAVLGVVAVLGVCKFSRLW